MKCPHCTSVDLVMTDRQGVEIDYCPSCRGVWLDRGELDKIAQRMNEYDRDDDRRDNDYRGERDHERRDHERRDYDRRDEYQHHPKKRKSFWSELFD